MTTNLEIAQTILNQFGGRQFIVMTGAKNFVVIDNGIRFQIGRNRTRTNLIQVTLRGDDTYTMQFWNKGREFNYYTILRRCLAKGMTDEEIAEKVAKAEQSGQPKMLKEYDGIYFDQLQELFTDYTGLYTRLF